MPTDLSQNKRLHLCHSLTPVLYANVQKYIHRRFRSVCFARKLLFHPIGKFLAIKWQEYKKRERNRKCEPACRDAEPQFTEISAHVHSHRQTDGTHFVFRYTRGMLILTVLITHLRNRSDTTLAGWALQTYRTRPDSHRSPRARSPPSNKRSVTYTTHSLKVNSHQVKGWNWFTSD